MTEYSPEDGYDMGDEAARLKEQEPVAEDFMEPPPAEMVEEHDIEVDRDAEDRYLKEGQRLRKAVNEVLREDIPHSIRRLVGFAARMDREMEEAVLMEGDDEWLASLTGPQLGDALSEAERMIRAGRTIKKIVEAHLEMDIRANGALRLGNDGYYVGPTTKRELIDPDGFLRWLGTPDRISKAVRVNSSNIRIGVVKGFAQEFVTSIADGYKEGDEIRGVIDSFFEETVEEEQLKKVPESRAKWVQNLKSGERR